MKGYVMFRGDLFETLQNDCRSRETLFWATLFGNPLDMRAEFLSKQPIYFPETLTLSHCGFCG